MALIERISTAVGSGNLKEALGDELRPIDIIRACGMAGVENSLGVMLVRLKYGQDRSAVMKVVDGLLKEAGLGEAGLPVVVSVIAHQLDDVCKPCMGRGCHLVEDTPVLDESDICGACRGTGKVRLPDSWGDDHHRVADLATDLEIQALARISRIING